MKLIKTVCCVLLFFGLISSFASCSPNKIIKDITGGNVDVDKNGNVKIKDNDGEVVIGDFKWDKTKMHGLDAPKAKLESSIVSKDGAMYGFSEMKENDAKSYIENLKDEGFTYNSVTLEDYNYIGTNKQGLKISFMYNKESGAGTVISERVDPPFEDNNNNGGAVVGTNKKWDSKEIGGLPDAGIVITSFSIVCGFTTYSFDKINEPKKYVEKIKSAGYTVDDSLSEYEDTIIYTAYNSEGDQINFISSDSGGAISFTKHE